MLKWYNEGKYHVALSHIEEIESHYSMDHPDFFTIKFYKAKLLMITGKFEKSEILLNSLLDFARRKGKKLERLDMIILLTDLMWRKGDWDRAFFMIEMGEYDFIKLGDEYTELEKARRYADLKRLKGIYYRYNGELDLSIEYYTESLILAERSNDQQLIAEINNLLGLSYYESGEINKAWNYFIKSNQLYRKINDKLGIATSLLNIGSLQEYIGEIDPALQGLYEALNIVEAIGNNRLKANIMSKIGEIYAIKGDFDVAFKYHSQSLSAMSEYGNNIETSLILYRLISLLHESEQNHLIPIFMDGLEQLYRNDPKNALISQHYRLIKAKIYMSSDKTIDRAKAQELYYEIMSENIINHELTLTAAINLCEILITEFRNTADPEVLDEITNIFNMLQSIISEHHSYPLMIEIMILQAKFSILEMEYQKAMQIYSQALGFAEQKNMTVLMNKISDEYNKVIHKVGEIVSISDSDNELLNKIELSELEEEVAFLIKERGISYELINEDPTIFIILNQEGKIIYSKRFTNSQDVNEQLIKSFITAINQFIKEAFPSPSPVERIKHGDYSILMREIDPYLFIYVYSGTSTYSALQRFDNAVYSIKNNSELLPEIQKGEINEIELSQLNYIIEKCFVKDLIFPRTRKV